jgi:hypothetical protein
MTLTNPQRWGRGLPHLLWKRLDMPGKVRSVGEHELEFTHERERPAE